MFLVAHVALNLGSSCNRIPYDKTVDKARSVFLPTGFLPHTLHKGVAAELTGSAFDTRLLIPVFFAFLLVTVSGLSALCLLPPFLSALQLRGGR